MNPLDDVLAYVLAATGRTVDQLTNLQRTTVAMSVAYIGSRGSPSLIQRALFNRFSARGASYVARHPLAFGAAYLASASSDQLNRPQWAGSFTREVNTAIYTPIFAHAPQILRFIATKAGYILRPEIAAQTRGVLGWLSRLRIPQIPKQILINRYTIATAQYIGRHPVAFLGAYFTSQYLNDTYRRQPFGIFSQEFITAGLTPVYAHGARALPNVIRGLGTGVYYASRGAATGLEFFIGRYGSQSSATRQGSLFIQAARPLAGLSFGLMAEFFQYQERLRAVEEDREPEWWARFPGSGAAAATVLTGISYVPTSYVTAITSGLAGGRNFWRIQSRLPNGTFANAPQRVAQLWRMARSLPTLVTQLIDYRFITPWPRTAVELVRWSWYSTTLLKIELAAWGLSGFEIFRYGSRAILETIATAGFFGAFLGTGTIRGTALEIAGWGVSAWHHIVKPVQFAARGLRSVSVTIANIPQARQIGRVLSATARGFSTISRFTGLALFSRTLSNAGLWAGAALDLPDITQQFFQTLDRRQADLSVLAQTPPELLVYVRNAMRERDQEEFATQTSGWTMAPSRWIGGVYGINYADPGTSARQILAAEVTRLQNDAQAQTDLANAGQQLAIVAAGGLDLLARSAQWISSRPVARPPWWQIPPFAEPEDYDYTWRTRPRSGNWPLPFGPTSQPQGFSFSEALNEINRRANAAQVAGQQFGGTGAGFPHSGGGSSAPLGHKSRKFWLYRGRDRNLMEQLLRDLEAIEARDTLQASGKKTTQISVRQPIFPNGVSGLQGAVIQLIWALKYDLTLVRNPGSQGGYYSVQPED